MKQKAHKEELKVLENFYLLAFHSNFLSETIVARNFDHSGRQYFFRNFDIY